MADLAILFDMDGVIVLSNPFHKKAWKQFFKKHGFGLTEDDLKSHVYGKINSEILKYYFSDISSEKIREYAEEKESLYRDLISNDMKSPDNLSRFLGLLAKNDVICAISTSAPSENVDFVLNKLRIRKYFEVIVDDTQVLKGKPDPEIYLKTAGLIDYAPKKCIVIEDSISGIRSGKNAGMKVIAITTTHTREELSEADLIIDDFSELTIDKLNKLVCRK